MVIPDATNDLGYNHLHYLPNSTLSYTGLIFLIWCILHIPLTITQILALLKRRHHCYLQQRGLPAHLWYVTVGNLFLYSVLLCLAFNPPCWAAYSILSITFALLVFSLIEKVMVVYYAVDATNRVQVQSQLSLGIELTGVIQVVSIPVVPKSEGGDVRVVGQSRSCPKLNPRFKSQNFSVPRVFGLLISVMLALATISYFFQRYTEEGGLPFWTDKCMIYGTKSLRIVVGILGFFVSAATYFLFTFRHFEDNFFFVIEAKVGLAVMLVVGFFTLIFIANPKTLIFNVRGWMLIYWLGIVLIPNEILFFLMSLGLSRLIDREKARKYSSSDAGQGDELFDERKVQDTKLVEGGRLTSAAESALEASDKYFENALKDGELLTLFERFLVKEFSVENLLMYRAASQMLSQCIKRDGMTPIEEFTYVQQVANQFVSLYDVFFSEESKLQVNISAQCMKLLKTSYNRFRTTKAPHWAGYVDEALDAVVKVKLEVFLMMKRDSFLRFKLTPEFKQWKAFARTKPDLGYQHANI